MGSSHFSALVILIFCALLSAKTGLSLVPAAVAASKVQQNASEAMAVPPKPDGGQRREGEGSGEGRALLTFERCEAFAITVRDVCWQALARQESETDPDGALAICGRIGDRELGLECVDDVAEAITLTDRARAEAICQGVADRKWRGQCWFGVGLAWAETDAAYALSRCAQSEAFERFCRHDVVGEVALVDIETAVAFCAREEGDELTRKTCWHGISKYLARRDFGEAAASCARATEAWQGTCVHGLGWGAAERDPDGTLARCSELGPRSDYCVQGVAHQQKRPDPTRALALCESIQTPAVRTRCLDFVTR